MTERDSLTRAGHILNRHWGIFCARFAQLLRLPELYRWLDERKADD